MIYTKNLNRVRGQFKTRTNVNVLTIRPVLFHAHSTPDIPQTRNYEKRELWHQKVNLMTYRAYVNILTDS